MNKITLLEKLLENLTEEQFDSILESVKSMQPHESADESESEIGCCPHCGSSSFIKHGKDASGRQRYMCKDCGRTFSPITGSFFSHSKVPMCKWAEFIDYEASGLTLKEESHYLKLSVHACFRMRHKLYSAIDGIVESSTKVGDAVELDSSYRKINLKGTKPWNMPRPSKKRGGGSAYSGISHHKICIAAAADSMDNMFLKIVGLDPESIEKYKKCMGYMGDVKKIISDSKSSIASIANILGADHDRIIPSRDPGAKRYKSPSGCSLGDVNELDSGITALITAKRGVSTRYLQSYLNFYVYVKQAKYRMGRDELSGHIFEAIKKAGAITEKDIAATEFPISLKEAYYEYRYGIFA